MSDKVVSSKNALNTMLVYYYEALQESGCSDIRKQIATDISNMMNITEAQQKYIETSKKEEVKEIIEDFKLIAQSLKDDNENSILLKVDIEKIIKILGGYNGNQ